MKRVYVLFTVSLLSLVCLFQSCSDSESKSKEVVVIGNEAWTVNRTLTYLSKVVFEKAGYEVQIKNQDIASIFNDLAKGKIDLYMDAWENAHYVYIYEHEGLEDLDEIYTGCQMGIAVPSYFDVDSICHLKMDSSAYDNMFYGIKRNAGVMISARTAFKNYNINPKVIEMEEDELVKQIELMVNKEQNFVVSAWSPHWKINHFGLKFLADTSATFGDEEDIHVYARPGFKAENPKVAQIASRMFLTEDQLAELLEEMRSANNEDDYYAIAKQWAKDNRDVVNGWLGKES